MREHLDTIPIWDAYKADAECPLCRLEHINEASYVENFLGASVMEPSTRVEVNKKGFCQNHFRQMFDAGNRLGLALIADTYMRDTIALLADDAKKRASQPGKSRIAKIAGRHEHDDPVLHVTDTCILCERLKNTMERYAYTIIYMWRHESEFRRAFESSKGFCIPHYARLLALTPDHLNGRDECEFIASLTALQMKNLARVEEELTWFTQKFDYRNKDKPWGNSQDAVERAILKLRGQMRIEKGNNDK